MNNNFIKGFIKRANQYGISDNEAINILKHAQDPLGGYTPQKTNNLMGGAPDIFAASGITNPSTPSQLQAPQLNMSNQSRMMFPFSTPPEESDIGMGLNTAPHLQAAPQQQSTNPFLSVPPPKPSPLSGHEFESVGGGAMAGAIGSAVAKPVQQPDMNSLFRKYHGGAFDPNSKMDQFKMQQLQRAQSSGGSLLAASNVPYNRAGGQIEAQ